MVVFSFHGVQIPSLGLRAILKTIKCCLPHLYQWSPRSLSRRITHLSQWCSHTIQVNIHKYACTSK